MNSLERPNFSLIGVIVRPDLAAATPNSTAANFTAHLAAGASRIIFGLHPESCTSANRKGTGILNEKGVPVETIEVTPPLAKDTARTAVLRILAAHAELVQSFLDNGASAELLPEFVPNPKLTPPN